MTELPEPITEVVLRVARRLGSSRDVDQMLRDLLDETRAAMRLDVGAVYRWDDGRALLVRVSATSPPPNFGATVRLGQGIVGEAAAQRVARTLVVDPRDVASGGDASDGSQRSQMAAPLVAGDGVCGVLAVGQRTARSWTVDDVARLDVLAAVAAPIVALAEAVELEAELRRSIDVLTAAARALAHDLNNDLTMPVGALELLRERPDLPGDVLDLLAASADDLVRIESRIRAFQQLARSGR